MKECVETTSFSVLVNGSSTGFFKGGNGLRQGDPLSPLLFTLVMEVLTKMLARGEKDKGIQPFSVHDVKVMSHLIFADDVLLFLEANEKNMSNMRKVLNIFGEFTGLKLNVLKTNLYLSKNCKETATCQTAAGMDVAQFPMKYLGFPLTGGKLKCSHFDVCYDRIKSMLDRWPVHNTSFAGRLTLVKSTVNGYIYFLVRQGEVPSACLDRMQMPTANFLWGGGKHYMSWSRMAFPFQEGGLNLRNFTDIAKAATMHRLINYLQGQSVWAK